MARKPTHRRIGKRQDSKKVRAAEDAALRGDHIRTVRTGGWAGRDDRQPPLLDVALPASKRKKGKETAYCPMRKREGKKRHYYIEKEAEGAYHYWWKDPPTELRYTYKYKVCMYCRQRKSLRRYSYIWEKEIPCKS